uniref:Uncharacterized protein n=1 Tax=Anopheles quadriannulatus TaxID=34691 RepID=A0A182XTB8_ANOQN
MTVYSFYVLLAFVIDMDTRRNRPWKLYLIYLQ